MSSYVVFCLAQIRLPLSSHCSPSGMTVRFLLARCHRRWHCVSESASSSEFFGCSSRQTPPLIACWTCGLEGHVGVVSAGADMCRDRMDGQPRSGQHIRSGLVARIVGLLTVGFADGVAETSKPDPNRHRGASTVPGTRSQSKNWVGVNADGNFVNDGTTSIGVRVGLAGWS